MKEKELYQQKKQTQLDEYEAQIEKLKANSSEYEPSGNGELSEKIRLAELKIKEGREKLKAFEEANLEELEAHKKEIDDTFISINIHLSMS